MLRKFGQRGFTLIELLIVIAIIGVLASIILASLQTARLKANDAKRLTEMDQVRIALELYALDHSGTYPCDDNNASCPNTGGGPYTTFVNPENYFVQAPNQENILTRGMESVASVFSTKAHAAYSNSLCNNFTQLLTDLNSGGYLKSTKYRDPSDDGANICYKYLPAADGSYAAIFTTLQATTYTNTSTNKKVGAVVGSASNTTMQAICTRSNTISGTNNTFPVFSTGGSPCTITYGAPIDTVVGVSDYIISYGI